MSDHEQDALISKLYHLGHQETPPPYLDRKIREAAQREVRRRRWSGRSFAVAASLVLGVAVSLQVLQQAPVLQEPELAPAPLQDAQVRKAITQDSGMGDAPAADRALSDSATSGQLFRQAPELMQFAAPASEQAPGEPAGSALGEAAKRQPLVQSPVQSQSVPERQMQLENDFAQDAQPAEAEQGLPRMQRDSDCGGQLPGPDAKAEAWRLRIRELRQQGQYDLALCVMAQYRRSFR